MISVIFAIYKYATPVYLAAAILLFFGLHFYDLGKRIGYRLFEHH